METVRLQKYFTDCGVLSRRAAEAEIAAGKVTVNSAVAVTGQKIDPERDVVEYRGVRVLPVAAEKVTVLLHKPRGFVTTLSDEKGRHTVAELVADVGVRLYPVGRLDMDSDGLLLMTCDGELANRLIRPAHTLPKKYRVCVKGEVSPAALARLNEPFLLDGYTTRPAMVRLLSREGGNSLLSFELYEGRNRQIRRMCEEVRLPVLALTRVAIGELTLGNLPVGHYRVLTKKETDYLKGTEV